MLGTFCWLVAADDSEVSSGAALEAAGVYWQIFSIRMTNSLSVTPFQPSEPSQNLNQ